MTQQNTKEGAMKDRGPLYVGNSDFLETMYQAYVVRPQDVPEDWRQYLEGVFGKPDATTVPNDRPSMEAMKIAQSSAARVENHAGQASGLVDGLHALTERFRRIGHQVADLDPLSMAPKADLASLGLTLASQGIGASEAEQTISWVDPVLGVRSMKPREWYTRLARSYAGNRGMEASHISNDEERRWLIERFEALEDVALTSDLRRASLQSLLKAQGFEQFLHTRFQGAKRFSIEGGDNTLVAAEHVLDALAVSGVRRVVLGMAHRGRLTMLTQFMQKPLVALLSEFRGTPAYPEGLDIAGDVKYHLGYATERSSYSGTSVRVTMAPNPSHLEAVNPVVLGKVRAEQDAEQDSKRLGTASLQLHGDAAFCGQGVVMEALMLSQLEGYRAGGTVHIVTNNQIGFTTAPSKARQLAHPTEIAKVIQAPIFHVHGDATDDVARVARLAADYRTRFGKDAVINLVCYRLYGHNEGDEPAFTQPRMMAVIGSKKTPGDLYAAALIQQGVVGEEEVTRWKTDFRTALDEAFEASATYRPKDPDWCRGGGWESMVWSRDSQAAERPTGVAIASLQAMGPGLTQLPESIRPITKVQRLLTAKAAMIEAGEALDWATGEALAFGSLLMEGVPVRLSGQDAGRGTFSHRHSVIVDEATEATYLPLNHLRSDQTARYEVIDSNLSEYGVLGFEYGYSMTNPNSLVLWEGQFGDFSNGAQIMIDQFIASGETKWQRMSGLVMLLPHGMEGQGPEHSSARLERYLQLCADGNMSVVYCTTPASYFHVLRRQMHRNFRRPLIVMTPKSLLRHKLAVSSLKDMDEGTAFRPLLPDATIADPEAVRRVIFCSGKVYYDLYEAREEKEKASLALVRLEQLYPFPEEQVAAVCAEYVRATSFVWCQEEPENQGAWSFVQPLFSRLFDAMGQGQRIVYVGRRASASPAVGYMSVHQSEQKALVAEALRIEPVPSSEPLKSESKKGE